MSSSATKGGPVGPPVVTPEVSSVIWGMPHTEVAPVRRDTSAIRAVGAIVVAPEPGRFLLGVEVGPRGRGRAETRTRSRMRATCRSFVPPDVSFEPIPVSLNSGMASLSHEATASGS